MSEMVTRVANAIALADYEWQDLSADPRLFWKETLARAAIAAMREPTEAMLDVAAQCDFDHEDVEDAWHAMIDEALK